MHSVYYGYSELIFDFQLNSGVASHRFRLRNANDFQEHRSNKASLDRLPYFDFPKIWNSFNPDIKGVLDKIEFKTQVKYNLLDNYSNFICQKLVCNTCLTIQAAVVIIQTDQNLTHLIILNVCLLCFLLVFDWITTMENPPLSPPSSALTYKTYKV